MSPPEATTLSSLNAALVHYWLVKNRGGEKVLEVLADLLPAADLYTLVHRPGSVGRVLEERNITTSFIQRLPLGVKKYRWYLPLMPMALEAFDLSEYDLVVSSESGPAKGVITRPETCHICYCHSPMRYLWNLHGAYRRELSPLMRPVWAVTSTRLRSWDRLSADRVDYFIANSHNVARRIRKYYRRASVVVHPPVDFHRFAPGHDGGYYLFVGEISEYKGIRTAVEAFERLGLPLRVVGDGPLLREMKAAAGPAIEFLGWQEGPALEQLYSECRAFVFPGEEDFGITPLEAMASGKPVIALGRGGALETVVEGRTGVFFDRPDSHALADAIRKADTIAWDGDAIRAHAERFSRPRFRERLEEAITGLYGRHLDTMASAGASPS